MNSTTTTLLAATLLAASSAFGMIRIGDTIGNTKDIYRATTFNYSENTSAGETLGGTGSWMASEEGTNGWSTAYRPWDAPLPNGQGELIKTGLEDDARLSIVRGITNPFTNSERASHVQLVFTLGSNTTAGVWRFSWSPVLGNNGIWRDITFSQTDINAEAQFTLTMALSETGQTPDGNNTWSLASYGDNSGTGWDIENMTGGTANMEVTFNEARFVTEIIVPEPATYGLIFGGFIFTYILIRRRKTRR